MSVPGLLDRKQDVRALLFPPRRAGRRKEEGGCGVRSERAGPPGIRPRPRAGVRVAVGAALGKAGRIRVWYIFRCAGGVADPSSSG